MSYMIEMTKKIFQLTTVAVLFSQVVFAQSNRITIQVPKAEDEIRYIWQQLQDLQFFIDNGYDLVLPEGELMEELKIKVLANSLDENDYVRFEEYFKNEIYQAGDYQKGFQKIEVQLELINDIVEELLSMDLDWDFKSFLNYDIILTLYGPGGSYNPDEGSIVLYSNSKGEFKGYSNPINTIVHEIVHIGIEQPLIQKYQISHTMKERIVDSIVSILFSEELPDYKIQDMGDYRIDPKLKTVEDILELEHILKSFPEN